MFPKICQLSVLALLSTLFVSCSAIQLRPEAARVIASKSPAPKGCKFVGTVVGSQGDAFTGAYTKNSVMAEGSMNDLRNKAAALGANYVQLETDRAGVTGAGSGSFHNGFGSSSYHSAQTDVTLTGNAYYCKPEDIGLE